MFVSHRLVSCDGGSVGRAKKKRKRMNTCVYFYILNLTIRSVIIRVMTKSDLVNGLNPGVSVVRIV